MKPEENDDPRDEGHNRLPYRKRADVNISQTTDVIDGGRRYFLKVPEGAIYEVGAEEHFLVGRFDTRISFVELKAAFDTRFGVELTQAALESFAADMIEKGVLEVVEDAAATPRGILFAPEDPDPRATPFRRTLFEPTALFERLMSTRPLWPVLSFLCIFLFIAGVAVTAQNARSMVAGFQLLSNGVSIFATIALSLFAVNMVSKLAQGAVAHAHGAPVKSFGVVLFFGFFPRFYIDQRKIFQQGLRSQRQIYATPLLVRMGLFGVSMLLWMAFAPQGHGLSAFFLLLGHMAAAAFLVTALPLLPTDGYHYMAALIGQPDLRPRSFRYLGMRLRGRKVPAEMTATDRAGAWLFASASALCLMVIVALIFGAMAVVLEREFSGAGTTIFAVLLLLTGLWLYSARKAAARAEEQLKSNAQQLQAAFQVGANQDEPGGQGSVVALQTPTTPRRGARAHVISVSGGRLRKRHILGAGGIVLLVILFLPYHYKPGGTFRVLPDGRSEVRARIDGEVTEIFVKEGDLVTTGQPLARLTNWSAERNIKVIEAELEGQRAVLDRLTEGAVAEEIALAQAQVQRAEADVARKRGTLERQTLLARDGLATPRAIDVAEDELTAALADLNVATANLALVRRSATSSEVAAAQAKIERLVEELAFRRAELERTLLVSNMDGRIVTSEDGLRLGDYLTVGELFAQIEDQNRPRIEIALPQTEARFIEPGLPVQVKSWGYSDRTVEGTVVFFAPSVDTKSGQPVIRVVAELSEQNLILPSDMTGFAKIETEVMPVWRAYMLFLIRFFQVEVWSWFP
ncbi:MAG: HlyD family efflux transporter periplasmic adaptor subunit [Pseudomonadota bacterium]